MKREGIDRKPGIDNCTMSSWTLQCSFQNTNTTSCKYYYDERKRKYKIKYKAKNGNNKQNKPKFTPNLTRNRPGLSKRKIPVQPTKH